jgi:hypothetical protein
MNLDEYEAWILEEHKQFNALDDSQQKSRIAGIITSVFEMEFKLIKLARLTNDLFNVKVIKDKEDDLKVQVREQLEDLFK